MQTRYKLRLSSNDAIHFFNHPVNWLDRKTIFSAVFKRLAKLSHMANEHHVYTCQILMAIDELIDHVQSVFLSDIAKYQKHLDCQGLTADKISADICFEEDYTFSNTLFFNLLRTIEYFDRLICLLITLKNAGLFSEKSSAFRIIDQHKRLMNTLMSSMLQIRLSDVPFVTVFEYLRDSKNYQKAAQMLGAINPRDVINVIEKGFMGNFSTKISNQLLKNLKARVGQ